MGSYSVNADFSKPSSAIILPIVSSNRFSVASRSLSPVMLFPFILRVVTIREQIYVTCRKHANNMLGKFAVVESFCYQANAELTMPSLDSLENGS